MAPSPAASPLTAARLCTGLWLLITAGLGSACGGGDASDVDLPPWPGEHLDLAYGEHERQRLDFYPVQGATEPTPVAVIFHQGGFDSGDKRLSRLKRTREFLLLQEAGIASAFPNYRLAPEFIFPDPLHDAARAVQYLRAHADELGVDPARLVLMGYSAGATLAGSLAYGRDFAKPRAADPVARQSSRPVAWFLEDGVTDFTIFEPTRKLSYFGDESLEDLDLATVSKASPLWQLQNFDRELVPCFLVFNRTKQEQWITNPHDSIFGDLLYQELHRRGDRASVYYDKSDTSQDWTLGLATWFWERFEEAPAAFPAGD